jgi:hypothetical protein
MHEMALIKLSKTQKVLISKVKKQSDVGHILQQSGNHSERNVSPGQTVNMEYYV